ncbi:aspartyl-tRNA(Asn)/glutamyl-tRNA(Gln) amidotransferase subunit A [Geodermatophilus siccatus]|uniref:Aspartyl-tRNA(Asn)/glutamyl-tRNA(Gln) amidotransferase subunit A n=1 Tax=Geodermatophilus siccatus TaxID=1137991 RepID=A0A1G9NAF7_9ACTN|nr:amidase family protein [Geodermatophilus siccatus]SDL83506.1 aspartyl-tRNA(Asn)/glutamyl-tRNA(Gln) amidotransferase subunit A [Geodermatophilus siccatus]
MHVRSAFPGIAGSLVTHAFLVEAYGSRTGAEEPTPDDTAEADGMTEAGAPGVVARSRRGSSTMTDICAMPATDLAAAVRAGEISPVDVVRAVSDRMDAVEPVLHAFCTPTLDLARQQAEDLADRIAAGEEVGPLAGVPVGIKDLVATKGIRTAMGSKAYEDFVPDEDDIVVERLKAADAIIIGKTNVPEFGYSGVGHNPVFETTRNPWNPAMTPGGSSAGSGAAVAAGMGPIAVGSDGGGSVRIPSAHCGLFGMKASMGRVPLYPGCRDERYPGVSSWESLEHIGPMSRTVADSALMLSVMAGPDPRDRHTIPTSDVDWTGCLSGDVRGLRVAFSPDLGYAAVDPAVREVVQTAVRVFEEELGCHVEQADPGFDDPYAAFWGIVALDTDLRGMRRLAAETEMSPHLVEFLARPWTAEDLTDAVMTRKAVNNRMWRFMEDHDLLLTPTLTVPPFPVHVQGPEKVDGRMVPSFQWLSFTLPINMTGQPAATVPAGWTQDGLPVGLQIVGRHLADETVLRAAAAFEAAAPWSDRWPALVRS